MEKKVYFGVKIDIRETTYFDLKINRENTILWSENGQQK